MILQKCIYLCVICEQMSFAGKSFHFFGHLSIIHKTQFDTLAKGGLRTNHSDSEPGGPRIKSVVTRHTCGTPYSIHQNGGFCKKGDQVNLSVSTHYPIFTDVYSTMASISLQKFVN